MERNRDFVTEMRAQMRFTFNFAPFADFEAGFPVIPGRERIAR
jgi:hypothetical protein